MDDSPGFIADALRFYTPEGLERLNKLLRKHNLKVVRI